jgi:hypothetical protein
MQKATSFSLCVKTLSDGGHKPIVEDSVSVTHAQNGELDKRDVKEALKG